jgi:hypothetical protein
MNQNDHDCCQDLLPYLFGELSAEKQQEVQQHLEQCSVCSDELQELQSVWNSLPLAMEEFEPPADLKTEIFNSIFPNEKRWKSFFSSGMSKVAAVLLLLLGGMVWYNVQLRGELVALQDELADPTQIVEAYPMVASTESMNQASGHAWILQNGDQKRLVIDMNGLEPTKGEEAYQVWLIHEGKRQNAGTFHVDKEGRGMVTYYLSNPDIQFESIGITLEPDPHGVQPRGKKVSGTI